MSDLTCCSDGGCKGRLLSSVRIQRSRQRCSQLVRLKSKWPRPALVHDAALRVDKVNAVGPPGIGLLRGVAELVEHGGKFYPQLPHASPGDEGSIILRFRAGKNHVVFDIALHLPNVAGMGLGNVNHQEGDAAAILLVEFVQGGNLPPERRSSVAAEHQHYRLPLV